MKPKLVALRRVVASCSPRMTTTNPLYATKASSQSAILFNSLNKIGAASRSVDTARWQQRADTNLIEPDHQDHHQPGKFQNPAKYFHRCWLTFYSRSKFPFDSNRQLFDRIEYRIVITIRTFSRTNNPIDTFGQVLPLFSKGFANQAFPFVSDNSVANLSTDGQPHPRHAFVIRYRFNDQNIIRSKRVALVNVIEILLL